MIEKTRLLSLDAIFIMFIRIFINHIPPPFFKVYNPASCSSPFIFSCLFHNVFFNHRYLNFLTQNHVFSSTLWLFFSPTCVPFFIPVPFKLLKPFFIFSVPFCPRFLSCPISSFLSCPYSAFILVPILIFVLSLFRFLSCPYSNFCLVIILIFVLSIFYFYSSPYSDLCLVLILIFVLSLF